MTRYQYNVYKAIKKYIEEHKYAPSIREICDLTGKNSTGTIQVHLRNLKRMGYIDYIEGHSRTIRIIKDYEAYDEQELFI